MYLVFVQEKIQQNPATSQYGHTETSVACELNAVLVKLWQFIFTMVFQTVVIMKIL